MQNNNKKPLQDNFLDELILKQKSSSIYLVNGIRLTGEIVGHDRFTVLVQGKGGGPQMIYKAAISTVTP